MTKYTMKTLGQHISDREEQELRRLWREAFEEEEPYLEYYHDHNLRRNRIWTLWDGETLVCMLHANPYRIWHGAQIRQSCFLVGVATDERYRRQGCMRQLMEAALAAMKAEKIQLVYLLPAREEYYLPFGFETVGTQHAWIRSREGAENPFPGALLPETTVTLTRLSGLSGMEQVELADFANQWLKEQMASFIWRDGEYYRKREAECAALGGSLYVFRESGRIVGLASLEQEKKHWRLFDVAGEDLIAWLKKSPDWMQEPEPQKIMIKWLNRPEDAKQWLPFAAEELT